MARSLIVSAVLVWVLFAAEPTWFINDWAAEVNWLSKRWQKRDDRPQRLNADRLATKHHARLEAANGVGWVAWRTGPVAIFPILMGVRPVPTQANVKASVWLVMISKPPSHCSPTRTQRPSSLAPPVV